MISIGLDIGGPEQIESQFALIGRAAMRSAKLYREDDYRNGIKPWVNVVFVVPGSLSPPKFEGYKIGRISKKERGIMIKVAVPSELVNGGLMSEFIVESLRKSIQLAADRFLRKKIELSIESANALISSIANDILG